jgi:hypothetical protein
MKQSVVVFAIVLAVWQPLNADPPDDWYTDNMLNGRFWNGLKGEGEWAQGYFLMGYLDRHNTTDQMGWAPSCALDTKEADMWPKKLKVGEVAKLLDRFYDEPENLNIPIRFALHIVATRSAGKSEGQIADETLLCRKLSADLFKWDHKIPSPAGSLP